MRRLKNCIFIQVQIISFSFSMDFKQRNCGLNFHQHGYLVAVPAHLQTATYNTAFQFVVWGMPIPFHKLFPDMFLEIALYDRQCFPRRSYKQLTWICLNTYFRSSIEFGIWKTIKEAFRELLLTKRSSSKALIL